MNKVQEALKSAIEALNSCHKNYFSNGNYEMTYSQYSVENALNDCKSALAEIGKCEPVYTSTNHGFVMKDRNFTYAGNGYINDNNFDHDAALKVSGDFATGDLDKYAQMITNHLNTSPISKEWVSLTNDEVIKIMDETDFDLDDFHIEEAGINYCRAIEAKLKQLNAPEKG